MEKDLKKKANEAKKRLASGYFNTSCDIITKKQYHSNGVNYIDEERMYKIVAEMEESNEVILNPLGRLINEEYFNMLDSTEKQRYVFKLSEIYIKLKNRYLINSCKNG